MLVILDEPGRLDFRHIPSAVPVSVMLFNGLTGLMAWGRSRARSLGPGLVLLISTSPFRVAWWLTFGRPPRGVTLRRHVLFGNRKVMRAIAGLQGASTRPSDPPQPGRAAAPGRQAARTQGISGRPHGKGRPDRAPDPGFGPEREAGMAAAAINAWALAGEVP